MPSANSAASIGEPRGMGAASPGCWLKDASHTRPHRYVLDGQVSYEVSQTCRTCADGIAPGSHPDVSG